jgi:tetratricopeptide (TPR) repeat protein
MLPGIQDISGAVMTSAHYMIELKMKFPEEVWRWLVLSLRQDPSIWNQLESTDLGRRALEELSDQPEDWSPASLALVDMHYSASRPTLISEPMQPLTPPLRRMADQAYLDWSRNPANEVTSLAQAGLIGLALREQRIEMGGWQEICLEILRGYEQNKPLTMTILACLFGVVSDPVDLLAGLIDAEVQEISLSKKSMLAIHMLLSNPLSPEEQAQIIITSLEKLDKNQQLAILQSLKEQRPTLTVHLTDQLKEKIQDLYHKTNGELESKKFGESASDLLRSLAALTEASQIRQLAADPGLSIPTTREAIVQARRLQALLLDQIGRINLLAGEDNEAIEAWKQATQFEPENALYAAGLANALLRSGRSEDAQAYLTTIQSEIHGTMHPAIQLVSAMVCADQNLPELAKSRAIDVAKAIIESGDLKGYENSVAYADDLKTLSNLLLDLGLYSEAVQIAEFILKKRPNDPFLLEIMARALNSSGLASKALAPVEAAVALDPDDPSLRNLLVEILENSQEWIEALKERRAILAQSEAHSIKEIHDWAKCALKAGDPDQAFQACEKALDMDPKNGTLYATLGQVRIALGDHEQAIEEFQRATQLAPHQAETWLAFADAYRAVGQSNKALEILRTASLATPNDPQIHLALGKAYLDEDSPTQALTCFRQAAALLNFKSASSSERAGEGEQKHPAGATGGSKELASSLALQIALHLGKTLHQLGHLEESRQVLEEAYSHAQRDPALAYAYAKVLLDLDEDKTALPALQVIVDSKPESPTPYLEYGRALLDAGEQPQRALTLLNHVIKTSEKMPELILEAQALLGEAYAACGNLAKARESFRQALDSNIAQEPAWRARLSLGFGKVNLMLGQVETALAALQEAVSLESQDKRIHQSLSEAYLESGLITESFQAAHAALKLNPSDLENLTWFVSQALRIHDQPGGIQLSAEEDAIQALKRATQIAPDRGDLLIHLGQLELRGGDPNAALETLKKLAAIQNAPDSDLYQAAIQLRQLGSTEQAILFLERAVSEKRDPNGQFKASNMGNVALLDLLTELSSAYFEVGEYEPALEMLDEAIQLKPGDANLYVSKADLLLQSEAPKEALAFIQKALELNPVDATLHHKAAIILHANNDLPLALAHAEQAAFLEPNGSGKSHYLAAELACIMLQPYRAREILKDQNIPSEGNDTQVNALLLRAELALESGEDPQASALFAASGEKASLHPRGLSVQARLTARHGDHKGAVQFLQEALRGINFPEARKNGRPERILSFDEIANWRGVADAALELAEWDLSLELFSKIADSAPQEPLSHVHLARALVLRAESQRLCDALEVVQHAPGIGSLSEESYQRFEKAIQSAFRLVDNWKTPEAGARPEVETSLDSDTSPHAYRQISQSKAFIERWHARGKAAFHPAPQSVQALEELPPGPDIVAALVSTLGAYGDPAGATKAAQAYPQHPWVLLQLALVQANQNPNQALGTATVAVEYLSQRQYKRPHETPLRYFLLARLAQRAGNHAMAEKAIQAALNSRPDEPRWHALAAEILQYKGDAESPADLPAAITHLEAATRLEPKYAPHYLSLGRAYLEIGDYAKGLETLEQACRIAPDKPGPWLALARAQLALGDLEQAAVSAENAVEHAEEPIEALLLRGEIALKTNNPRGAQSRAQAVLHMKPDDPQAMQLLAHALKDLNRPAEALEILEKAIPLVENPLPLQLERAELLRISQGQDTALNALQDLANHYPQDAMVLATLAEALMEGQKPETAIQAARQALQIDAGELPPEAKSQLNFLIGRQQRHNGQLDQAIHHLTQAIQLWRENLEAYLELGLTHQDRRQQGLALKVYQQAMQIASNDYRPYYQAGLALKESKDYMGAESMLRRAAQLAPNDVSIHRLLGAVVALNLVHNRHQTTSHL